MKLYGIFENLMIEDSACSTIRELCEKHKHDLRNADLRDADLAYADLSDAINDKEVKNYIKKFG